MASAAPDRATSPKKNEAARTGAFCTLGAGAASLPCCETSATGAFPTASVMPLCLGPASSLLRARCSRPDTSGKPSVQPAVHRELPGLGLPCARRVP
jgi:hypothetical protein